MPGVPSFRGCSNCRVQKKKCDQARPACSRCARLRISCVGCGEQRYKFIDQRPDRITQGGLQSTLPSNDSTKLAGSFVSTLKVADVRFDLSIYGSFFNDIPRRLGTNKALDAAVWAITTAAGWVRTRQPSAEIFRTYADALKALRICLDDTTEARSANTLCAIYLIVICHSWIAERHDPFPRHFTAMAHVLDSIVSRRTQSRFENELIHTLTVLLIVVNFGNSHVKIQLDRWLPSWPKHLGPARRAATQNSSITSLDPGNIAEASALLADTTQRVPEVRTTLEELRADCAKMKRLLSSIDAVVPGDTPATPYADPVIAQYVRYQGAYSTLLWMTITFNAVLRAYEPCDQFLVAESVVLVDEATALAEVASKYRPLGSSFIPLCLVYAHAATDDVTKRAQVEKVLAEYQLDFPCTDWLNIAAILRAERTALELRAQPALH